MEFKSLRCPSCGAPIPPDKVGSLYHCPFCDNELVPQEPCIDADYEISGGTLVKYKGTSACPTIPASVQKIGQHAFSNTYITKMIIPDTVIAIEAYAFSDCPELQSVYIPASIREIGNRAFCRCFKLTDVVIDTDVFVKREIFVGTPALDKILAEEREERLKTVSENAKATAQSKGCYIATAVYGSYDCPQVWTLRRYRDLVLADSFAGRAFIKFYYAVSPKLVKLFGKKKWFSRFFGKRLDKFVKKLNSEGYSDTPYCDFT